MEPSNDARLGAPAQASATGGVIALAETLSLGRYPATSDAQAGQIPGRSESTSGPYRGCFTNFLTAFLVTKPWLRVAAARRRAFLPFGSVTAFLRLRGRSVGRGTAGQAQLQVPVLRHGQTRQRGATYKQAGSEKNG